MKCTFFLFFILLAGIVYSQSPASLSSRFEPPAGFSRVKLRDDSFGYFLRTLPLKPKGSLVKYYDGTSKQNYGVYAAVVDLPIGTKNLHQCADAVMHLRAEYLWQKSAYDSIQFHLTNGFLVPYSRWKNGERVVVDGNKTYWKETSTPSTNHQDFWKYLEFIFTYAGTLSLEKELSKIPSRELHIGDVWIKGGSPGHAVIVVDVAKNEKGETAFMLAQSYMPAQELQILQNPNRSDSGPWYFLIDCETLLHTPEWNFTPDQLRRFQ